MSGPPIWLPYSAHRLAVLGRCPACGFHPPTQGHRPECPTLTTTEETTAR